MAGRGRIETQMAGRGRIETQMAGRGRSPAPWIQGCLLRSLNLGGMLLSMTPGNGECYECDEDEHEAALTAASTAIRAS